MADSRQAVAAQNEVEGDRPHPLRAPRETHQHLCDACKQRAVTAERQAQQPAPEHQEQDQAVPEQKAGGTWLSRFPS
ncbi:hypothetical protein [Streptomyces hawaiiensis]|uniref:hypothetical protein n=1 Tax=Streptomyces hawaiiensis TaxID=67305 RepID=UPI0015861722|nr:hypothetical protein [Streptomyces hawaiiensis]